MKLIQQGAEAKVFEDKDYIIKERIKKSYRIQEIDLPLRKTRTNKEANLLNALNRAGIPVPRVFENDNKNMILKIEKIEGIKIRDYLEQADLSEAKKICAEVGDVTAKIHSLDIVHGDLTTSNMILRDKVYIIDFGLGEVSSKVEDKAVDLHLFKECLKSRHFRHWKTYWDAFKGGYFWKQSGEVLHRLNLVESRGRYKHIG